MKLIVAIAAVYLGGTATTVHTYAAFVGGNLSPRVHVLATRSGSCWSNAIVENRRYAWRCASANYIYDPCFSVTLTSSYVVCPRAPWSSAVMKLKLTRPLPRWSSYLLRRDFPWGIRIADGKRCASYAGTATASLLDQPMTYYCSDGGYLVGFVQQRSSVWTIDFAAGYTAKRLTRVRVTDAWW